MVALQTATTFLFEGHIAVSATEVLALHSFLHISEVCLQTLKIRYTAICTHHAEIFNVS